MSRRFHYSEIDDSMMRHCVVMVTSRIEKYVISEFTRNIPYVHYIGESVQSGIKRAMINVPIDQFFDVNCYVTIDHVKQSCLFEVRLNEMTGGLKASHNLYNGTDFESAIAATISGLMKSYRTIFKEIHEVRTK